MKRWFQALSLAAVGLAFSLSNQSDLRPAGTIQRHESQEPAKYYPGSKKNIRNFKSPKAKLNYGQIPIYFVPNKGQVDAQALFYARASSYTLWITKTGFVFDTVRREKSRPKLLENAGEKINLRPEKYGRDVSRLLFKNANKTPEIMALEPAEHRVNYLIGNDSSKWRTDIQTSKSVGYKELYPKIDLKVYGAENQIEYDWVIHPGGKAEDIRFEYLNVQGTRLDGEGNLIVQMKFGEIMHRKPTSFQFIDGHKVEVDVKFRSLENNIFGFEVDSYDKEYPLIVDPQVLFYSTYLGGGRAGYETEWPGDIAVDNSGCAYVTGYTTSPDFPTRNAYDSSSHGSWDIFITKFTAAGNDLSYSTFLGGNSVDMDPRIAVDSTGCAYVTGETWSPDFPTYHAFDDTLSGSQNIFVTKLTASGNALVYSTYLGGSDREYLPSIAVDSANSAYISGVTYSGDFPVVNAFQSAMLGKSDGFVTKLTPTGDSLIFSTFLGGSDYDDCEDMALDSLGCVYVTGYTLSIDFPTKNAYQSVNKGGHFRVDNFLTKFSSDGGSLVYSTYFGTEYDEERPYLAVDESGCAYLTGSTWVPNFPVVNAFDPIQNGGYDAFVTKFSAKGDSLIYSTFLGGRLWDLGYDIAVDSSGCAYVVGQTESWDFPIKNAYQSKKAGEGGGSDIFIAQLSPEGNSLVFSTYFGGTSSEEYGNIAVDDSHNIYILGETTSENLPLRNPFDSSIAQYQDLFVASFCSFLPPLNFSAQRLQNNFIFYKEYVNRLTWQLNPDNKVDVTYKIYRKPLGGPDSAFQLIAAVGENDFTYDDRSLKKNDFYSYRITSVDKSGYESDPLEAHNVTAVKIIKSSVSSTLQISKWEKFRARHVLY